MIQTILPAIHVSPETAFIVEDYPFGFRLRCKMRVWLETKKGKGVRMMRQTSNPKAKGETFGGATAPVTVWNKPKASTYAEISGALYLDENGHVQWSQLSQYSEAKDAREFLDTFGDNAHNLPALKHWVAIKEAFEAELQARENPAYGTPLFKEAYLAARKKVAAAV